MSQPSSPQSNALLASAFLESLIRFLMPYFIATCVDLDAARAEIIDTLNTYGARTRAEMLTAARIIAFGMATLDALADATAPDLSPAMKIRCRGCANNLNRSTIQNEKALDLSLARDLPPLPDSAAEPANTIAFADARDALEHAQAAIQAHRRHRATTGTPPDRNKQLWAGAMMDTLKEMGFPNGASPTG